MPNDLPAASVPSPQPVAAFVLGRKDRQGSRGSKSSANSLSRGSESAGVGCCVLAEFGRKASSQSKFRTASDRRIWSRHPSWRMRVDSFQERCQGEVSSSPEAAAAVSVGHWCFR